jgi:5-methylcytosine-specific restriction endonuclease McrA
MAAWRKQHPERNRETNRKWRKAHPDRVLASVKKWQLANRDRALAIKSACDARRRARKMGGGGSHTHVDWIVLCWASGWRCFYCKLGPLNERTAVKEHMVPLARGGSNAIGNIAVSCATCNNKKRTKTVDEFLAWRATA